MDTTRQDHIVKTLLTAKDKMHFSTEIIIRLLDVFLKSTYENTQEILLALKSNDIKALEMKAHAIRGGALALDLEMIATLCHALEYGNQEKETDYQALWGELDAEVNYLYTNKECIFNALKSAA